MFTVLKPQVVTVTHETCKFHQKHPGESFAGCTCSGGFSSRDKRWNEMTKEEMEGYLKLWDYYYG